MALANIGLDLLGQARSLYAYAAEVEAAGHDEDGFAYLRDAPQYRNLLLLEQPNGDFARPSCGSSSTPPSPIRIGGR